MSYPVHFMKYNEESPFHGAVVAGSRMAVKLPFFGSFCQMNGIYGANPSNFKHMMEDNRNFIVVPGGFEEATVTSDKEYRLWINDRKGFIKYSLQSGYRIHPVFVF